MIVVHVGGFGGTGWYGEYGAYSWVVFFLGQTVWAGSNIRKTRQRLQCPSNLSHFLVVP